MVNEGSGHNCPIWAGCLIIAGGTVLVTFLVTVSFMHTKMVVGTQFCRLFGYYCPTIEIRKV
ncbi:BFH_collapsed_G0015150.mRNA.1.CDS.1 [Saccharomyces cerevisiae]|nr:BFH_collapsed_G0015150.mRNA.1.CDS.1 [Saccharomyces cerevisiae]